jgi:16S rRNA (adenine1518-N6/adenine1519-N6)-dimethyltransferase
MYRLKKSLGQHFLHDEGIIAKIIEALKEESPTQLLEVGPGGGAITKDILEIPELSFKAVELDMEKINFLERSLPSIKGKLIHDSILDMEIPFEGKFIVIGNFPYNISSQILFKMLEWKDQVPVVIGMFQKEVAQRASASPGNKDFGVLSALLQPYYDIEYLFDVPAQSFTPPPKVMSGVIKLRRKTTELNYKNEKSYRMLVKTAFNQRRKTLRNATRGLFSPETLQDEIFNRRAETLSIEEYAALSFRMEGFE